MLCCVNMNCANKLRTVIRFLLFERREGRIINLKLVNNLYQARIHKYISGGADKNYKFPKIQRIIIEN